MFLKKSLLFMTALALLMFTGQASAQLSLSLGDGGSDTVSGQGTTITVELSQMGVAESVNAIEVEFDVDSSVLTLTGGTATGFLPFGFANNTATFGAAAATAVPASASFTFTTASDVTGVEFSIGIKSIKLNGVALAGVPLPSEITFNAGGTSPGGGGGGGDGDMSVSLSTDGDKDQIVGAKDIVIDVAVSGMTGQTTGAEIVFAVSPNVAEITDVEPAGLLEPPNSRTSTSITLVSTPTTLSDGRYGSVTFTTKANVTEVTKFSIGVKSLTVFKADGTKESVAVGEALKFNQFAASLDADDSPDMVKEITQYEVKVELVYKNTIGCEPNPVFEESEVVIEAKGFPDVMAIKFPFEVDVENRGLVTHEQRDDKLTLRASGPVTVRVLAEDGTLSTPEMEIEFVVRPELRTKETWHSNLLDGEKAGSRYPSAEFPWVKYHTAKDPAITICTAGLPKGAQVTYDVNPITSIEILENQWQESDNTLTLNQRENIPAGEKIIVEVFASAGGKMTDTRVIRLYPPPEITAKPNTARISPRGSESLTANAGTFIEPSTVEMSHKTLYELLSSNVEGDQSGTSYTVSAENEAEVEIMATETVGKTWPKPMTPLVTTLKTVVTFTHPPWLEVESLNENVKDVDELLAFVAGLRDDKRIMDLHEPGHTEALPYKYLIGCDDDLGPDSIVVLARNFETKMNGGVKGVRFPFEVDVENRGLVTQRVERDSILILRSAGPVTVRLTGTTNRTETTEATEIDFVSPGPELRTKMTWASMPKDDRSDIDDPPSESLHDYPLASYPWVKYQEKGDEVTVCAVGLPTSRVTYDVNPITALEVVDHFWNESGDILTLNQKEVTDKGIILELFASTADGKSTDTRVIRLFPAPEITSDSPTQVDLPKITTYTADIVASAGVFIDPKSVVFSHEVVKGESGDVTGKNGMKDGLVVYTVTSSSAATVEVMAVEILNPGTVAADTTTVMTTIKFTQDQISAPSNVVVQDLSEDNGHYVMLSFTHSANHEAVSQYRVYREMMVNDAEGNPVAEWVPWTVLDAVIGDSDVTRAVIPVPDGRATRWGVAAEWGGDSSEVTPSGKRVFSKESVQLLVEVLGVDPNLIVSEDELTQMFMPSAEYIQSIIGDRKNVVFAALDPDVSVLIGGDQVIPQNIRTGSGGIFTSPIVATEDAVAAVDNVAPAAVTDVAGDAETGMVTWTVSTDDKVVGAVEYRGFSIPIPGVIGYKVMGGVSEDAMLDIGVVPAGSTTFQVPVELLQSLIDRGVPAVMISVVAMDGTNMTPSTPLVVLLAPTRKAFVDADGGPVYIVKLENATTPLIVDFEDFVAFTMAFNTSEATSTREEWRVFIQSDLNDDGMVNFDDFILFFGSYGKEATGRATKSLIPPLGVNETAELSLRLGSDRVVAGETMFVDVSLANVQALMGYGFVLNYDAEKFEFVEAIPAAEDLLMSSGGETPLLKGWSPEAGQVRVMNAIVNGSDVSGGGDIVRLVFRVLRDFEDNARFEIAEGLVFDPSQLANPLAGGVLDIQTTPTEFALLQNFPNPFNPETTIGYELAESADVTLQIYNVVGQVVRTLMAAEPQSVGRYQVRWDGMDDRGMPVSSGIYFYQISAGKFQDVRKLMLLK